MKISSKSVEEQHDDGRRSEMDGDDDESENSMERSEGGCQVTSASISESEEIFRFSNVSCINIRRSPLELFFREQNESSMVVSAVNRSRANLPGLSGLSIASISSGLQMSSNMFNLLSLWQYSRWAWLSYLSLSTIEYLYRSTSECSSSS